VTFRPLNAGYPDNFEAHSQHIPRISWVNNPIIKQGCARAIGLAIPLHTVTETLDTRLHLLRSQGDTLASRAVRLDRLHDAGKLVWTHDAASSCGPGEQKSWLVRSSAHGVISGAVGGTQDDGDVWDGRATDCGYKLSASLDNSCMLGLGSYHEACDIVEEDDGYVPCDYNSQLRLLALFLCGTLTVGCTSV
jgi:hypothetical protein